MRKFFSIIIVIGLLALAGSAFAAPYARVFVGCTLNQTDIHDQHFPNQTIGNIPHKVVSWELVFQKGVYGIRVASRFEFIPYIYKMINGKYTFAGMSQRVNMQNDKQGNAFFYYDFTINHINEAFGNKNWWLIQIKPVPSVQSVPHIVRLITKPTNCPKANDSRTSPCPTGQCGQWSTFGSSSGCRNSAPGCLGWECGQPGCP
jgi:hypothetical protein